MPRWLRKPIPTTLFAKVQCHVNFQVEGGVDLCWSGETFLMEGIPLVTLNTFGVQHALLASENRFSVG